MYFNSLVIYSVLIYFPTYLLGSKCTKYYILLSEYYDTDSNVTSLDTVSEKINWNRYNIYTNVSELKDFNHECVVYVECLGKTVLCRPNVKPTFKSSIDEIISSDTTRINKDDYFDKETAETDKNIKKTIDEKDNTKKDKEITEFDKSIDIPKDIAETIFLDNHTLAATEAVGIAVDGASKINGTTKLEITTANNNATTDKGNNTIVFPGAKINTENKNITNSNDKLIDAEVLTNLNDTNRAAKIALDNKFGNTSKHTKKPIYKVDKAGKEAVGIAAYGTSKINGTTKLEEITTANNNASTDNDNNTIVFPDAKMNTENNNKTNSKNKITDAEVFTNLNDTNRTAKIALDNKSGNTSKHTKEPISKGDKTIVGKIAIGILGAGVSIALVFLAKHYILGCIQSGAYNVPEA